MKFTKCLLFSGMLLILLLPLLQQKSGFFTLSPVLGNFRQLPPPRFSSFSLAGWMSGSVQQQWSDAVQDNAGFRHLLFRVNNQYEWSAFRKIAAKGFVKGKKGYLFQEEYLLEYNGSCFIGENIIRQKIIKLQEVQDSLQARGICLIPVIEPGKASFFPELIPVRYLKNRKWPSNYDVARMWMNASGLKFLDMNALFVHAKDSSRYPLFQPYGMHWSVYGEMVAMKWLMEEAGRISGLRLPQIKLGSVRMSDSLWATDYDIGNEMNLLCRLPGITLPYPEVEIDRRGVDTGTRVLVIADSYYKTVTEDLPGELFPGSAFWYYNSKIYPHIDDKYDCIRVDKSRLLEEFSRYNMILLMSSEINLHSMYWSFIEEAYAAFHPGYTAPKQQEVEDQIRNNYDWFFSVWAKSRKLGRPLELQIREDAAWMARQ